MHGPRHPLALLGSPHAFILAVCVLLLIFVRTSRRGDQTAAQVWLERALLLVVVQMAFTMLGRLGEMSDSIDLRALGWPLFDLWLGHVATIALIGAFLRYSTARLQPARSYLIYSIFGLTGLSLGAAAAHLLGPAAPSPHRSVYFLWLPFIDAVAVVSLVAGLWMILRYDHSEARTAMLAGVTAFLVAVAFKLGTSIVGAHFGPPAGGPGILLLLGIGYILFGHAFIRLRSAEIHTDIEVLEDKVRRSHRGAGGRSVQRLQAQ